LFSACVAGKRLFGRKDLRLRGSISTKLVNEAMDHFSAVYDLIALTRGGNLSEEQQLVLDHEKLFFL
jgi:hypothetical protein